MRRLCESGFSLYASEAYLARRPGPVDVDDLSGHDVVDFDPAVAAMPAAQWLAARAARATIVMRGREMIDVVTAAASGLGLAVLPCLLGDAEPALRRLVPGVVATRELSLVYRREARPSASVRAVVRFVVDTIRGNADQLRGTRMV